MPTISRHNPGTIHAPAGGYSMGLGLEGLSRLLFISGQVPKNEDGTVPETFKAQCEQAWRNVICVLEAAGLTLGHLVKVTTFLTDRSQAAANRAVRARMLEGQEPASTVIIAETLDARWMLEIEAIAAS